jgi:hypothetical protein
MLDFADGQSPPATTALNHNHQLGQAICRISHAGRVGQTTYSGT